MTPLTLFLAKLIGLTFLIFSLFMALRKQIMVEAAPALLRDRGLILTGGALNLCIGLAMVIGHNFWSGGPLTIVVTLIGWLILFRGIFLLFAPPEKLVKFVESLRFEQNYHIFTGLIFVIGLYLTIGGFTR